MFDGAIIKVRLLRIFVFSFFFPSKLFCHPLPKFRIKNIEWLHNIIKTPKNEVMRQLNQIV